MEQDTTTGVDLIAAERRRQVEEEGFDAEHDAEHEVDGALAWAAACYAAPEPIFVHREAESSFLSGNTGDRGDRRLQPEGYYDPWPWDAEWDKRPHSPDDWDTLLPNRDLPRAARIRQLVKAGAFIAAAIDDELRRAEGGEPR